jgi:hypothetical protein
VSVRCTQNFTVLYAARRVRVGDAERIVGTGCDDRRCARFAGLATSAEVPECVAEQ